MIFFIHHFQLKFVHSTVTLKISLVSRAERILRQERVGTRAEGEPWFDLSKKYFYSVKRLICNCHLEI